jgi:RNA-directed DNA polymerase
MSHPWEGDQPGVAWLGCTIRPDRVGKPQAGKGPGGHQHLGDHTLLTPAKAHMKAHLAELGRGRRAGPNWPQAALLHQLTPNIRGGANDSRPWGSQATLGRLDRLTGVKRRSWARRRHPNTSARWAADRYGHRREARQGVATSATRPSQAYLASPTDPSRLRYAKVTGHRRPYDGEGVYGSQRRRQSPMVSPRLATLLKQALNQHLCHQGQSRAVTVREATMTNRVSCNGVTISAVKSIDGIAVNILPHRLYPRWH